MAEHYFQNRQDAGKKLTQKLNKYRGTPNVVVLALPRGGVVVASEIAKSLNLPLGLVVVRKIGHPLNPEFAIAAISESGQIVRSGETNSVDPIWFQKAAVQELQEARRRRQTYWHKKPLNLKDKIAIIVDDGLATGLTMKAAILEVKSQNPQKVVVAVPVSPLETAEQIKKMADDFVFFSVPENFYGAVGLYYQNFPQTTDKEVIRLLK